MYQRQQQDSQTERSTNTFNTVLLSSEFMIEVILVISVKHFPCPTKILDEIKEHFQLKKIQTGTSTFQSDICVPLWKPV